LCAIAADHGENVGVNGWVPRRVRCGGRWLTFPWAVGSVLEVRDRAGVHGDRVADLAGTGRRQLLAVRADDDPLGQLFAHTWGQVGQVACLVLALDLEPAASR